MNTNSDITENESITEKMIVVSTKNNKKITYQNRHIHG